MTTRRETVVRTATSVLCFAPGGAVACRLRKHTGMFICKFLGLAESVGPAM